MTSISTFQDWAHVSTFQLYSVYSGTVVVINDSIILLGITRMKNLKSCFHLLSVLFPTTTIVVVSNFVLLQCPRCLHYDSLSLVLLLLQLLQSEEFLCLTLDIREAFSTSSSRNYLPIRYLLKVSLLLSHWIRVVIVVAAVAAAVAALNSFTVLSIETNNCPGSTLRYCCNYLRAYFDLILRVTPLIIPLLVFLLLSDFQYRSRVLRAVSRYFFSKASWTNPFQCFSIATPMIAAKMESSKKELFPNQEKRSL